MFGCSLGVDWDVGLPWKEPVDVFALGCLLAEVHVGARLFPITYTVAERVAMYAKARDTDHILAHVKDHSRRCSGIDRLHGDGVQSLCNVYRWVALCT